MSEERVGDGAPAARQERASEAGPRRLVDALRQARIEEAERTGVVVDLRDAELARLQILNEALDPLFSQIPEKIDLFDRGISQGDTPRLWLDMVAHVAMGRDKRAYRLVQDTRFGRKVLAESHDVPRMVDEITTYVARRMIEREKAANAALSDPALVAGQTEAEQPKAPEQKASMQKAQESKVIVRRRGFSLWAFVLGMIFGALGLFAVALMSAM